MHMRIHTGEHLFSCTECGAKLYEAVKRKHMRIQAGEKPYLCTGCGTNFYHAGSLRVWMRMHTREKPFYCKQCESKFSSAQGLPIHARKHTGEKPYICTECGAKFSVATSLKTHMRVHTGKTQYACSECGARFCSLKDHMPIDTKEKPYKQCDKVFSMRQYQFCISTKVYTGETPFHGTKCGAAFYGRSDLKKHDNTNWTKTFQELRMWCLIQRGRKSQDSNKGGLDSHRRIRCHITFPTEEISDCTNF